MNVKVILTTIAMLFVLSAIGCSHNPMSLNDSTPVKPDVAKSSAMTISFKVLPVAVTQGAMKKTLALVNYSPAYAIIQNYSAPTSRDSVAIGAGQTTASLTKTLTQNTAYNFYVWVYSAASAYYYINSGSAAGTVPKIATCTIPITCASTATNFVANITLGAVSSTKAIGATLIWKQINVPGGGQPCIDSAKITFPVGTTTTSINGLVYLAQAPDPTQYLMILKIPCNEGGTYFNNVVGGVSAGDAITLLPSTPASLTFSTFTELGGPNTNSLAKADITVAAQATATGTAALPKAK